MMKRLILFASLLIGCAAQSVFAQPFSDEIQAFKQKDSISAPPANAILFIGSSSFRFWTDVSQYFPGYTIINRGFGGSTLPDVLRYADDIIFPYNPKQIVIYAGENDFVTSDTPDAKKVFERFKDLFELIRNKMPNENIVFISMKPSPSRQIFFPKIKEANLLIKTYLSIQTNASFVDIYRQMLNPDGTPNRTLFKPDMLHMLPAGYAIWQKALQPVLVR
jgi:lysophospholipase L1-like esterase